MACPIFDADKNKALESNAEQQLLERIRASDHKAFEQLHETYYAELFVMAMKKLGDRDARS
ncbi:MAG: hypothetical protein EOO88_58685 [Pedobacter sp.]|nr:MAG: hypothetical protein EOO88_58685 [Pedobacter sp.]